MINLNSPIVVILLKVYVTIALVAASILSPLALSFVPILLLAWYLFTWRWPITAVINLLTEYFMLFAIALLFTSTTGPFFALLISLPLLFLTNHRQQEVAESLMTKASKYKRWPTGIYLTLLLIVVFLLAVSLLMGNLTLLLVCIAAIIYFGKKSLKSSIGR